MTNKNSGRKITNGKTYEVVRGDCNSCAATSTAFRNTALCASLCPAYHPLYTGECWREVPTALVDLHNGLHRIAAMCGNPDAAQACRNILAEVKKLQGTK